MASSLIEQLKSISGLKIECPKCNEPFSIKRAKLFSMYGDYPRAAQNIIAHRSELVEELRKDVADRISVLKQNRVKKPQRITVSTEATNIGQRIEQIAPALLTFPYRPAECRILLKPIDYIVFSGLSNHGRVEAIRFVELKTGNGRLLGRQKQIRDCIGEGKIKHRVIG
jgi:predicted Holliday junction resolvase-like endonuclease